MRLGNFIAGEVQPIRRTNPDILRGAISFSEDLVSRAPELWKISEELGLFVLPVLDQAVFHRIKIPLVTNSEITPNELSMAFHFKRMEAVEKLDAVKIPLFVGASTGIITILSGGTLSEVLEISESTLAQIGLGLIAAGILTTVILFTLYDRAQRKMSTEFDTVMRAKVNIYISNRKRMREAYWPFVRDADSGNSE